MPRVVAVPAGGAAAAVRFVRVLVGVGVFLLHEGIVVSAVLGTGRQAVPALPSPLVVVILVGGHEAAPLDGRALRGVAAVPPALALRGPNKGSVNTQPGGAAPAQLLPAPPGPSSSHGLGGRVAAKAGCCRAASGAAPGPGLALPGVTPSMKSELM